VEEGDDAEDDGGDDLVLVTDCGTELRLSQLVVQMSTMLSFMADDDLVLVTDGCIHIPNVDADILWMVVAYCEKHKPYYDPVTVGEDRDPDL
jgi:hypothetical protein